MHLHFMGPIKWGPITKSYIDTNHTIQQFYSRVQKRSRAYSPNLTQALEYLWQIKLS